MMKGHGPNCSCRSCVSRSSEHLPPRGLEGSQIVKLYSGKHIPAREKKLLDKLVKARAAYDELREEILSNSNVSVHGIVDLRHRKRGGKEDDTTERSSGQAILKLVDIVDRGGSTKDLSECCSCCICKLGGSHSSYMKPHRHSYHYRRHRYARNGGGHALSTTSTERYGIAGGSRSRTPARFITKSIRSVPCTCTYELIKRKSQAMIKRMKLRPENSVMTSSLFEDETFEKHGAYRAKALVKKSLQKLKKSESRIKRDLAAGARTSMRKARQSKHFLEKKLKAGGRKSVEKLKATKRKIEIKADDVRKSMQLNLQAGARKSMEKFKTTKNKINRTVADVIKSLHTVPRHKTGHIRKIASKQVRERTFPLKKDSITKFREKIRLLEEMSEWACEHECFPEECVPEDCLKILLKNRSRSAKHREETTGTNRIRQRKKKVGQSSSESSINAQVQENTTHARVGTSKVELMQDMERTGEPESKINLRVSTNNDQERSNVLCDCLNAEKTKKSEGIKKKNGTGSQKRKSMTKTVMPGDRKLTKVASTGTIVKKEMKKHRTNETQPQITISVSTKSKQERTKVSCECLDAKTRKKSKGIKKKSGADRLSIKRKSMTDATLADRKLIKLASTGTIKRKESIKQFRPSKASSISSVQQYATRVDSKPRATVSASSVIRQAVRISSSFSFSIEFYKNKPSKLAQTEHDQETVLYQASDQSLKEIAVIKRHNGNHASKPTQIHRASETRLKKLNKDAQIGDHALKRCICNLKLKSKRTKIKIIKSSTRGTRAPKYSKGLTTESVQTKMSLRQQTALRPYECEPDVCIPGECDPFECYELIKKRRDVKHRSSHTPTGSRTRSISSYTKSTSNRSSKTVQAYPLSRTKETQQTSEVAPSRVRPQYSPSPKRQAVRIGSSFSFNIELFKDKPENDNAARVITTYSKEHSRLRMKAEPKKIQQNKEVDRKGGHVRNRYSKRSMSIGKSKHTATKHSLRRCFCIMKLKPGNARVKPQSTSKIFMDSKSTVTQTPKVRAKQLELPNQDRKVSPHQCEPGICVPGECNPYKCLVILNKRKAKHLKHSYTENSRTKSSSSFESQSVIPSRAKGMQSNILTYKTEVPRRKYKEKIIKTNMSKEIRTSPNSSNRQAVRIGSSFSFDIEFHKDRKLPINNNERDSYVSPPRKPRNIRLMETSFTRNEHANSSPSSTKPKKNYHKKNILRQSGSQGDINHDKVSVPVQVKKKERNERIESIINRCFCTLNFKKNMNRSKVKCSCKEMVTIGTETSIIKKKTQPIMVTKGTKTKRNKYHLQPYECEPYVCVPGECDPHECLKRIKRRKHLKEFGTSTDPVKMRPGSSFTQNLSVSSGIGPDGARSREQKTSTKVLKKRKYATSPNRVMKSIYSVSKRHSRQPVKKSIDSIPKINSRQAVRIGSSLSFEIEFYKDRQRLIEKTLIEKSSKSTKIKRTDSRIKSSKAKKLKRTDSRIKSPKGMKITDTGQVTRRNNGKAPATEISTNHEETQAEDVKKKHKATGIKPILKRCFCTLQLRKKEKKQQNYSTNKTTAIPPQVYTVSRVTVAETKVTTQRHEYEYESKNTAYRRKRVIETKNTPMLLGSRAKYTVNKSKLGFNFNKLSYFQKIINKWPRPNVKNSNLNNDVTISKDMNTVYNICHMKNATKNTSSNMDHESLVQLYTENKWKGLREDYITDFNIRQSQVNGVNSFLSRCYCTMNIRTDAKRFKLQPYECEPGVCVPYECDTYECQKRINRRLKASKMSGTDATSRSTSSYSNLTPSQRARKHQSNIQLRSAKTTHARQPIGGIKYETGPNKPHKQMVRVGSSFSFDIQFSKDKSPAYRKVKPSKPKYHSDTRSVKIVNRRTKGTRGRRANRHNRDSQSGMTMVDRGASVSPRLKRCFCTLKLHKKGKQEQQVLQSSSQGTMTIRQGKMEAPKAVTATTGQNTRAYKLRTLDPNECEPGVCIPGECNPHDCLQLIKRRNRKYKTRGFSTASTGSKSASSVTDSRRGRGQRVQSDLRRRRNRGSVAAIRDVTNKGYTQSTKHFPPNRQVVRIGSTFSFNIEFYKDRTPHTDRIQAAAKALKTRQRKVKTKRLPKSSSKGLVNRSIIQHSRDSQAGIKTEHQGSGSAPRLKRCFCTLKLQKQGQRSLQTQQVKLINQGTKTRAYQPTPTLYNRSVMTKGKLKPYECESGVCVPGECYPYDCDKLIQKRLRREFGTSTGRHRTRSAVSSTSSTTSRARKVQYAGGQHRTRNKPIQSRVMILKPVRGRTSKTTISGRPSRQAVKIGSSFSFNVEFFKDKGANAVTIAKSPEYVRKVSPSHVKLPKVKRRAGYTQDHRSIHSTDSQIAQNMRSAGTGIKPMLKRCFCTLSLKKPKTKLVPDRNMLDAGTETHKVANKPIPKFTRTAATRTKQVYHLKSYECQPGICVPGKCDPYECLKRIKRREMRSRMAGTHTPRGRSISSSATASGRASQTQSTSPRRKHRTTNNNTTSNRDKYLVEDRRFKSIENPFRHAVRISSSFSFNIEFYKDRLSEMAEMNDYLNERKREKRVRQEGTESRRLENKGVCKGETCLRNRHSQSYGTKTESRGIGVGPMLKRCFCTLKLQKIGKNQQHRIPDQSDAMTSTPRHYRQYKPRGESVSIAVGTKKRNYDLKPYECEPNVCVPGECDPYECLERMKRRNIRNLGIGTENLHGYNRSTATLTRRGDKYRDTQCYRDPNSKCRSTQCHLKTQQFKGYSAREPKHRQRYDPSSDNSHRQSFRIGSHCSFDIEFFKDRKTNEPRRKKVIYENFPTITPSMKARKYANSGSHVQNRLHHQTSQGIGPGTESRGSVMPLLKRCFCTLKLRKDPYRNMRNETKTVNFVSLDVNPPLLLPFSQTKKTKCISNNTINSYKCNSYICTPRKRDRFESLKKLVKKRQCDHPKERTHTEEVYYFNMVNKSALICKSTKVQLQDNELEPKIVKRSQITNNLCDKVASTISNHVETNTKQRCQPKAMKVLKKEKTDIPSDKNKFNKCMSQSNCLSIKNKRKGKISKRCSRTLKLQHTPAVESYPKKELTFKRIYVDDDVKMSRLYHSKRRITNLIPNHGQKTHANRDNQKSFSSCKIFEESGKLCHVNKKNVLNEMETIFPYIPNKFNKNASKTVFFPNNKTLKTFSVPLDTKIMSTNNVANYKEKPKKLETGSSTPKNKFSIKEIIKKCTQLFKKSPKTERDFLLSNGNNSEHVGTESKVSKTKKEKRCENGKMSKTDILKSSKSDRRPSHYKSSSHSIPKKSKSLKIARTSEKCRYQKKYAKYINEGTKKYSRFQSGDAGQGYIKPVNAYLKKLPYTYNNNFHCSYCQVLYDKDRSFLANKEIPTFMDEKVVQLTLVSPKHGKLQKLKHKKSMNMSDECNEELCPDVNKCKCTKNRRDQLKEDNETNLKGILKNGTNIQKPTGIKKQKQEANETHKRPPSKEPPSKQSPSKEPPSKIPPSKEPPTKELQSKQRPTKGNKLVCKTKKPCACCEGARKKAHPGKGDPTPGKQILKTFKKDKCKLTCMTETEEEAGKPVCIKMLEKCIPKLYDSIPHHGDKCVYDPMFSMRMDSNSMTILNRDEIYEKVTKLKSDKKAKDGGLRPEELKLLHGKSCSCCICQSMKHRKGRKGKTSEANGQHQGVLNVASITAKASQFGRKFGIGKEPCICGSAPCAAEVKKKADKAAEKKRKKQKKPCVCGTKICEKESIKMDIQNHIVSKKGGKKLQKILKQKAKNKQLALTKQKQQEKAHKEWILRQKRYKKEDAARRKKRKREEVIMNKQVKKYKNTNSWLLAAESILDVGQLIYKSTTGFLRFTGRAIMDPKRTSRFFRETKEDPSRILRTMQNTWSDSGVLSTARRVGMRVGAMSCVQRLKACLESYAVTHYLIHMFDKNPKARLSRKKKLVRKREPMDFQCSLYMSSLRKRPWLSVYYKFQWFYPHCISLLRILRSVVDVLLFLVAVVVWSPCLFCIELCRALMCCTLCTG